MSTSNCVKYFLSTFYHLNLTETTWDRVLESRTPNSELQCWVTGAPLSIKRFSHRHILIIGTLMYIANAGDARGECSIPGSERSLGEGNGNPLQYSCLKNPMDRGLVGCSPKGHKESDMTEQLSRHTYTRSSDIQS